MATEKQTLIQNAEQEKNHQATQIIQELNNSLNLGLNEPNLEQVISKIKDLINKPPQTIYQEFNNNELESKLEKTQQTIIELEKQLANQDTLFGENLAQIKEICLNSLERELNIQLSAEAKQQIQQAKTYTQYASLRNAEIKQYIQQNSNLPLLNQVKNEKSLTPQANQERIIWISLLVVSLLSIGGLLVKLRKNNRKK